MHLLHTREHRLIRWGVAGVHRNSRWCVDCSNTQQHWLIRWSQRPTTEIVGGPKSFGHKQDSNLDSKNLTTYSTVQTKIWNIPLAQIDWENHIPNTIELREIERIRSTGKNTNNFENLWFLPKFMSSKEGFHKVYDRKGSMSDSAKENTKDSEQKRIEI